jgi:hypothetical protein
VQTFGRVPRVIGTVVAPRVAPPEPGSIVGNDGGELGNGRLNPAPLGGEAGDTGVDQDHGGVRVVIAVLTALSVQMQPGPVVVDGDKLTRWGVPPVILGCGEALPACPDQRQRGEDEQDDENAAAFHGGPNGVWS